MAQILIVDDEPDTRGLIELTLQTAGYEVKSANSGESALRLIDGESFDLILLDIMMPDVSGFDVLRKLNTDPTSPPVIFLSAKNNPEDQETGESLGAAGYLVKPTTRGDLLDAVREIVGS